MTSISNKLKIGKKERLVILDIVCIPNKILRKRSKEVNLSILKRPDFIDFIWALGNTMFYYDGLGLSAIQVGLDIRLFIVRSDANSKDIEDDKYQKKRMESIDDIEVFINPEILEYSEDFNEDWEGCLSIPGVLALIKRSNRIKIKFFNLKGQEIIKDFEGFKARIIQHEYDHINGVLILDKAMKIEKD